MFILDFNEILNSTISGLICAITIALGTYLFKVVKEAHNKDKILFWLNTCFYFNIFAIVYSATRFRIDLCSFSPLSFGDVHNLTLFITLISNIVCTIIQYNNVKKYINTTNQNNC